MDGLLVAFDFELSEKEFEGNGTRTHYQHPTDTSLYWCGLPLDPKDPYLDEMRLPEQLSCLVCRALYARFGSEWWWQQRRLRAT